CASTRLSALSFLAVQRPARSTLFPYTTLFRSFLFVEAGVLQTENVAGLHRGDGGFGGRADAVVGEADRMLEDGCGGPGHGFERRSEEHTSELQSRENLVCRLLLEKKKAKTKPL